MLLNYSMFGKKIKIAFPVFKMYCVLNLNLDPKPLTRMSNIKI